MYMISSNEPEIRLDKYISKNLILRNSADRLFKHINDMKSNKIILNFNNIKSVNRAFSHQYLVNKKLSKKDIIEVNLPSNVKKMFDLVRNKIEQQAEITQI